MSDQIKGEEIDFTEMSKEAWNEYKLKDGTTIKVKYVVTGVFRVEQYNPNGDPIYGVRGQIVVRAVNVPYNLKAKPSTKNSLVS